ncbi:MAG: tryptophan-rich sensory protein [Cyanobacteria bacterium P01_A01_bin.105]
MVPAWLVIAGVGVAIAVLSNRLSARDIQWFQRLRRPAWLTFEIAIPLVWIVVFICGGWSAYLIWQRTQSWGLMLGYGVLELLIMAYTPVMCKLRSLRVGTAIGAAGFIFGLLLAMPVGQASLGALLLLMPYLLWSPVGTFITWQMIRLNPDQT